MSLLCVGRVITGLPENNKRGKVLVLCRIDIAIIFPAYKLIQMVEQVKATREGNKGSLCFIKTYFVSQRLEKGECCCIQGAMCSFISENLSAPSTQLIEPVTTEETAVGQLQDQTHTTNVSHFLKLILSERITDSSLDGYRFSHKVVNALDSRKPKA